MADRAWCSGPCGAGSGGWRQHGWSGIGVCFSRFSGLLFVLPLSRELSFVVPGLFRWPVLAAIGMIWHITVWMGMAAIGLGHAVRRALRRIRREAKTIECRPFRRSAGWRWSALAAHCVRCFRRGSRMGRVARALRMGGRGSPHPPGPLPKALDGFTIVQISDLHVGTFIAERELAMGLGLIEGIKPDLVVITGDIVDSDPDFHSRWRRASWERYVHAKAWSASRATTTTTPASSRVLDGMRRGGIDVLLNRGKVIAPDDGGGFALLGVDDLWMRDAGRGRGPDLALAQSMVPPDLATVLLAHQPRFARGRLQSGDRSPALRVTPTAGRSTRCCVRSICFYQLRGRSLRRGLDAALCEPRLRNRGPPVARGAPPRRLRRSCSWRGSDEDFGIARPPRTEVRGRLSRITRLTIKARPKGGLGVVRTWVPRWSPPRGGLRPSLYGGSAAPDFSPG